MSTGRTPPPSPPWHGALFTAALFGGAGWLLVYTLLSIRPLEALGAWNYVGVSGLLLTATLVAVLWRGET
jgi:hypothetical protein